MALVVSRPQRTLFWAVMPSSDHPTKIPSSCFDANASCTSRLIAAVILVTTSSLCHRPRRSLRKDCAKQYLQLYDVRQCQQSKT